MMTKPINQEEKIKYMQMAANMCAFHIKIEDLDKLVSIYEKVTELGGKFSLMDVAKITVDVEDREKKRKVQKALDEVSTKVDNEVLEFHDIPNNTFNEDNKYELYELLKEHSIYKVEIKVSANNVEHTAILFTGFDTGSYWVVYNNSYDAPIDFNTLYSIKILQYLGDNKEKFEENDNNEE